MLGHALLLIIVIIIIIIIIIIIGGSCRDGRNRGGGRSCGRGRRGGLRLRQVGFPVTLSKTWAAPAAAIRGIRGHGCCLRLDPTTKARQQAGRGTLHGRPKRQHAKLCYVWWIGPIDDVLLLHLLLDVPCNGSPRCGTLRRHRMERAPGKLGTSQGKATL